MQECTNKSRLKRYGIKARKTAHTCCQGCPGCGREAGGGGEEGVGEGESSAERPGGRRRGGEGDKDTHCGEEAVGGRGRAL